MPAPADRPPARAVNDDTVVLVVEDDRNIVDLVRANLMVRGFDVLVSRPARASSNAGARAGRDRPARPHAPRRRRLRPVPRHPAGSSVGIIVVSARRGEQDKVPGPQPGRRRLPHQALRRRRAAGPHHRPAAPQPARPERLRSASPCRFGTFGQLDLDAQSVTGGGEAVHLTPTEFALLRELALAPGKLLTHAVLLREVWGPGYETETEYTRVYVRRLRAKLEIPTAGPHRHRAARRVPDAARRRLIPANSGRVNPPGLRRVSAQSQVDHKFECEREHYRMPEHCLCFFHDVAEMFTPLFILTVLLFSQIDRGVRRLS